MTGTPTPQNGKECIATFGLEVTEGITRLGLMKTVLGTKWLCPLVSFLVESAGLSVTELSVSDTATDGCIPPSV